MLEKGKIFKFDVPKGHNSFIYLLKGELKVGDKNPGDFDIVLEELILRDHKDSTRDHSPLKKADDALEIDTTHLTINEVVNIIVNTVNQKRTLY